MACAVRTVELCAADGTPWGTLTIGGSPDTSEDDDAVQLAAAAADIQIVQAGLQVGTRLLSAPVLKSLSVNCL